MAPSTKRRIDPASRGVLHGLNQELQDLPRLGWNRKVPTAHPGRSLFCWPCWSWVVTRRKRPFEKPALSIPDPVERLRGRGLVVNHVARAEHWLGLISCYRLRPCWLPFESRAQHDGDPIFIFRKDATFEDVLTLYGFDQQLRRLVLDGVESVEGEAKTLLTQGFRRSNDTFAEHYRKTYTPAHPCRQPGWPLK